MRRMWVYVKVSTLELAIEALKRIVPLEHWYERRDRATEIDLAAEDLKRSRLLSNTGASREEIEVASHQRDANVKAGK